MIGPISMFPGFFDYLINALWQAPLLSLGAWALVRLGDLGPLGRHRVWLACLVLATVVPALSHISWPTNAPPSAPTPPIASHAFETAAPLVLSADVAPASVQPTSSTIQIDERVAWGIAAVFALAVVIGLSRLVASLFAVRALLAGARPVVLSAETTADLEAFMRARRRTMPQIRCSARVASPAVAGVFRATILTPPGFADRPDAEVRAALLHELAHVVRRDYAVNLASEVLALPLCWHPALHLILAEVRRSRELVCDAMASAALRSQRAYAQSLVSLAGAIDPTQVHGASAAVGLFGKPLLEERLMHLIGPKRSTGPALKAVGLVGGVAIAAGVLGAASLLHVSTALAQSVSEAPTAPQATPSIAAVPEAQVAPTAPTSRMTAETAVAPVAAVQAAEPAAAAPAETATDADEDDDNAVVIDRGHPKHKHKWISASGKTYTVINDEDGDLTPAEQAKLEKSVVKATAEAMKAEAMVNSPEFKAKLAAIKSGEYEMKAKLAALKALDDPKIKAEIARAQSEAMRAQIPLAKLEALKALDDPKIKAKLERARRLQDSPEWRKAEADMQAAAARLDELAKQAQDQVMRGAGAWPPVPQSLGVDWAQ